MKALEFLNQIPPAIKDNFNRDCSLLKTKTCVNLLTREFAPCFVCHSAVTRSTFNVNAKEHDESYALLWWVADSGNQSAVNVAVESLAAGHSVASVWRQSIAALHPGVTAHGGDRVKKLRVPIFAERASGKITERINALTFAELHCKLGKAGK